MHVEAEMMERLLRRELSVDELAAVLRHIESCGDCATRGLSHDAIRAARAFAESFDEPERHLDAAEEMIPYADGTLDAAGREIVESHLDDCAMCRAELEDLQRLAARSGSRSMWTWIAIAAALAIGITVLLVPRSGVERTTAPAVRTTPPVSTTPAPPTPTPTPATPRYRNPEWARLVDTMLAEGRLPVAKLPVAPPDVLRGPRTEAATLSPAGITVDATRPLFTWPGSNGATYVVSVFSGEREIGTSGVLREHRWKPARALDRGRTYVWQVEVRRDGSKSILPAPPAPPATFRVVSARDHADLAAARAAHPDDALLLAALSARAGLESEAKAQLRLLEESTDPRVKKLLQSADPN